VPSVEVAAITTTSTELSFAVTFTSDMTSGNQRLLQCLPPAGCQTAGCQPKYAGVKAITREGVANEVFLSDAVQLTSPAAASTAAASDVFVQIECSSAAAASLAGSATGVWRYVEMTNVDPMAPGTLPAASQWYPIPPAFSDASASVPVGSYDLRVNMQSCVAGTTYDFAWSLASCAVAQESPADANNEAAVCSNRGRCNSGTGTCSCFSGYNGLACDQITGSM
jgi:hypothetical protein